MARGYLFKIDTEIDVIDNLSPDDVTGDIGGSEIDWSERVDDRKEHIVADLADRFRKCGAKVSEVTDTEGKAAFSVTADDCVRQEWFKARFEIFKDIAASMSLDDFCDGMEIFRIKDVIEDRSSDMVYLSDYNMYESLDAFVRGIEQGQTYYITDVILIH